MFQLSVSAVRDLLTYMPAQIYLALVINKKPYIVPISGLRKVERIRENFEAVSDEEYAKL